MFKYTSCCSSLSLCSFNSSLSIAWLVAQILFSPSKPLDHPIKSIYISLTIKSPFANQIYISFIKCSIKRQKPDVFFSAFFKNSYYKNRNEEMKGFDKTCERKMSKITNRIKAIIAKPTKIP